MAQNVQNHWERKISESRTLAELFTTLLAMKRDRVVVQNDRGEALNSSDLAEQTYTGILQLFTKVNVQRAIVTEALFKQGIPRLLGIRETVKAILSRHQEGSDGKLPENIIPHAVALAAIDRPTDTLYQDYKLLPPQSKPVVFQDCLTVSDILARVYELQTTGRQVVSTRSAQSYKPTYVARIIKERCETFDRLIMEQGSDFNIVAHEAELRAIPSDVRIAFQNILHKNPQHLRLSQVRLLADTISNYRPPEQREYDNPETIYPAVAQRRRVQHAIEPLHAPEAQVIASAPAPVPADPQVRRPEHRRGWLNTVIACSTALAVAAGGTAYVKKLRPEPESTPVTEVTPTPLSTPDMMNTLQREMEQREVELRASEPIQWHDLTPAQKLKFRKLLEQGNKYYLPFASSLMKASSRSMNRNGDINRDAVDAITDLKVVAVNLEHYYNLNRVRGFTVDLERAKPGQIVLGQMQGGATPENIADDVFAIHLPSLEKGDMAAWVPYHEEAHGFKGGQGHVDNIAELPRDQAEFTQRILDTKDYCYYLTALMGTADYVLKYYEANFKENLRQATTPAEKQALSEKYKVDKGEKEVMAEYMAQLFFETHQNTSLQPLGVTQKELAKIIERSNLFELSNELIERGLREANRETQRREPRERSKGGRLK